MAKHKKKISKPTPEPEDTKEATKNTPEEIPETEKTFPTIPPFDPSEDKVIDSEKDRKLNTLFWLRVGLAVIAGTIATFIFEGIEGEERRWASIIFMIIIFAGTIVVARGMKMQLPASDRKKIVTQGIGSFVFLYLFTWIITYTIVHAGSVSSGINI